MKNLIKIVIMLLYLASFEVAVSAEQTMTGEKLLTVLPPNGYVNDFADILNKDIEKKVAQACEKLKYRTPCEIYIITVKSTLEMDPGIFAQKYLNYWLPASNPDTLCIFIAEKDNALKIYTGRNFTNIITEDKLTKIIDENLLSNFKAKEYNQAIYQTVTSISKAVKIKRSLTGPIAAIVFCIAFMFYIRSYLMDVFKLLYYSIVFNNYKRHGYEKISGIVVPADNINEEDYFEWIRGTPGYLSFLTGETPYDAEPLATVVEDIARVPLFKVGIAKISMPFLLCIDNDTQIEIAAEGYSNSQLQLGETATLIGIRKEGRFLPVFATNQEKVSLGFTEIIGLIISAGLLWYLISLTIYYTKYFE